MTDQMLELPVVVTGAAGFLGRHVVEQLCERRIPVVALSRGIGSPEWLNWPWVTHVHCDLTDPEALKRALPAQARAVIHLAANLSTWPGHAKAVEQDNLHAARHVIAAAQACRIPRVVVTSTLGVFAPQPEPLDELSPLADPSDRNPYLASKIRLEVDIAAARAQGQSITTLYPGHLLGPHDQRGWIQLFDNAAHGRLGAAPPGSASFCDVRAVAAAHIEAALRFNVGARYVLGGAEASYREVFQHIARLMGSRERVTVAPAWALQTVAWLQQGISTVRGVPPQVTRGLADVLCARMVGSCTHAKQGLGYRATPLDNLLELTWQDWTARRLPLGARAEAAMQL